MHINKNVIDTYMVCLEKKFLCTSYNSFWSPCLKYICINIFLQNCLMYYCCCALKTVIEVSYIFCYSHDFNNVKFICMTESNLRKREVRHSFWIYKMLKNVFVFCVMFESTRLEFVMSKRAYCLQLMTTLIVYFYWKKFLRNRILNKTRLIWFV